MPRHNPLYTERFDQILHELVKQVGTQRWADIARQMKNIYDIEVPQQTMVQARWKAIDPKFNREPFNPDEMSLHWKICVKYSCNWEEIRKEYERMGQYRDKGYLASKFYQLFQFRLTELNRGIAAIADYNQQRIDLMRETTKKRVIEFNGKDIKSIENQPIKDLVNGCKTIVKVMSFVIENYKLDNRLLIEEVKNIISVERFQQALLSVFVIDSLVLIACNDLKPVDDPSDIIGLSEQNKEKYKKPTVAKFWDSALIEASSSEHTEDEEILTVGVQVNKYAPQSHLTKKDIEEIKESQLYKYCSTDQNYTFYNWYNQAKVEKTAFTSDLLVNIKEFNDQQEMEKQKEKQKPENRRQMKKKTPYIAKKQMKVIEKKKKQILMESQNAELMGDNKIKTVRGRIKVDKKLFHGQYTRFFDKDEDQNQNSDSAHYSIVDVDQIYQMNLMMNQKGL